MANLTAAPSIGEELRRMRLRTRADQLTRVLAILRGRAQAADADSSERRGLRRALAEFDDELAHVRAELRRADPVARLDGARQGESSVGGTGVTRASWSGGTRSDRR